MFNALSQLKIIQYWWWFWRQWCRDEHQALTGILTEQKLISDCRYREIESSSLVPVLFKEVFSHPYISFFHLLVNGFFCYLYIYIYTDTDPITLPCSFARAGKKYGNKGWAFDYPVSAIWNQFLFCQDLCQCLMLHPYITASKTRRSVEHGTHVLTALG